MSKDDFIKLEAVVEEVLPSTTFNVRLDVSGRTGKWPSGTCPYQRKAAYEFHPYLTG